MNEEFGYEWERFGKSFDIEKEEKIFFDRTQLKPEQLKGKKILDIGCGIGRYCAVMSKYAASVTGIDIIASPYAKELNKDNKNVTIMAADLHNLPFEKESFDVVVCIGVLHHTKNSYNAFQHIIPYVKKNGLLVVRVYSKRGVIKGTLSDVVRTIFNKIPHNILWKLSYLSLIISSMPVIKHIDHLLYFGGCVHGDWKVRHLNFFDRYSAKIENRHSVGEVINWFEKAGFNDLSVFSRTWYDKDGVKVIFPRSGYPKCLWWLLGKYNSVGVMGVKKSV